MLREQIEENAGEVLSKNIESIGFMGITGDDEIFVGTPDVWRREGAPSRGFGTGEDVRDWTCVPQTEVLFPYDPEHGQLPVCPLEDLGRLAVMFWPFRANLRKRLMFGKYPEESGLAWFEYRFFAKERYRTPLSIAFAFVATHNHFVLDRGGKVFNRTAPVIKLAPGATEDDHLALLGPLNSSTGCFWMQQTFHNKGGPGGGSSKDEKWHDFYEHDGTKLKRFPLPAERPLTLARRLDALAQELSTVSPAAICARDAPKPGKLAEARKRYHEIRGLMISLQEELDWEWYRLYAIHDERLVYPSENVPPLRLGERAFEIILARKIEAGEIRTAWFEWNRAQLTTETPSHWPDEYRKLVQRRIEVIEKVPEIGLIERPECKRRWEAEPWESQEERALRGWLLDQLENKRHWPEVALTSTARLADLVRRDEEFMQVAALYRKNPDFDVAALVAELVEEEAVPFLPVYRYKESGLRKRKQWDETWELQRKEDAIDAGPKVPEGDPSRLSREGAEAVKAREVGDISVPPKYSSKDFRKPSYWRLRGKLDVPKERFVSYPGCEREADPTTVVAWAGWSHLEQAKALGAYYVQMRDQEGWGMERLIPLLAGIVELLPWLRQWHNEIDPEYGVRMGDFYGEFVREEARRLGLTEDAIASWQPRLETTADPRGLR